MCKIVERRNPNSIRWNAFPKNTECWRDWEFESKIIERIVIIVKRISERKAIAFGTKYEGD